MTKVLMVKGKGKKVLVLKGSDYKRGKVNPHKIAGQTRRYA